MSIAASNFFVRFKSAVPERAIPPLDGPFRQNDDLESAWPLLERLDQPDDVTFGPDGVGYLSINGAILAYDNTASGQSRVFAETDGPAGGLSVSDDGRVAACVEGRGVVVLSPSGAPLFSLDRVDGHPLRAASAVLFLADGSLAIAEASTVNPLSEWRRDYLECRQSGRILRWWPVTGRTEILASNLAFPYGLAPSSNGSSIVFTEAWRYAISELSLEGGKCTPCVRREHLPGFPTRIRCSKDGGYWVSFFGLRSSLVEFVRRDRAFCAEMMRSVKQEFWIAPELISTAHDPHPWKSPFFMKGTTYLTAGQVGSIRRFGAINPWAPSRSYGLVAKLDADLEPVMSFHARANSVYHGMTGIAEEDGALFIVCKGYGALLKCSNMTAMERASEAIDKRKRPKERIRSYLDQQAGPQADAGPIVEVRSASKYYGSAPAIDDVSIALHAGEVHALLGENGAGKSTLCKALAGAIELTSGSILVGGEEARFRHAADSLRRGIAMVYQETSLVPHMTVAQNIVLGNERRFFRMRRLNIEAQQFLSSLNFSGIDVTVPIASLGQGQRQMVEIARALFNKARVIIFDEPTSALSPGETMRFFELIEMLKRQGVAIVFISHNLEEAMDIADRITVMRDGRVVASDVGEAFTRTSIVHHMVGREMDAGHYTMLGRQEERNVKKKKKMLSVENVRYSPAVKSMSFSIYAGEITCIAGLVGSGRSEIARVIAGALKRDIVLGGHIYLEDREVSYRQPIQAIRDGIVYVTEDRKIDGFFETMGSAENIFMGYLAKREKNFTFTKHGECERVTKEWIEKLQIHSIDMGQPVNRLSGGNQQKVVLGKSLIQAPRLIIVDEPTRGVDVGAISEIHALLRDLVRDDVAVVVISSYLPEVLKLADRILVARQGQIVAEFASSEATETKIMAAAISV